MTDIVARAVVVRGQVQGVFFRDTCRRLALDTGVRGWVSNAADGSLHALFEGAPDAVQGMVDWVHEGPPLAVVERVAVHEVPAEDPRGFEVR